MPKRYAVGVVNYQTYEDLARCLASVKAQTVAPALIQVVDADPDPVRLEPLKQAHPDVEWLERPNRGFGAGANVMLRRGSNSASDRTDAVLVLNPDVELAPDFCEKLLDEMRARPRVAIASGKLVRPEGVIDSAGIALPRHRRPFDRGSGEVDRGQYDRLEQVFAVCGAAMMVRSSALKRLAVDGEVFDEDFFAYREDTDLCWRARRLDYEVLYVPAAVATHVRRWRPGVEAARSTIALEVRRHSFKNHYLQILKNEEPRHLLRDAPLMLAFELARFCYVLLRDPKILPAYIATLREAPHALRKRERIDARMHAPVRREAPRVPARTVATPVAVAAVSVATSSELT